MTETSQLQIPADLLPSDGRFGAGPSKVRKEQVDAIAAAGSTLLGLDKTPAYEWVGPSAQTPSI